MKAKCEVEDISFGSRNLTPKPIQPVIFKK